MLFCAASIDLSDLSNMLSKKVYIWRSEHIAEGKVIAFQRALFPKGLEMQWQTVKLSLF